MARGTINTRVKADAKEFKAEIESCRRCDRKYFKATDC